MKTIIIIATLFLSNLISMTENKSKTVTLTVEFDITKHNKGSMFLALYDSQDTYMKKGLRNLKVSVKDGKAKMVITDLAPGDYGFSYFHDVNDDGKLNKNFLGIPKEPYGFSNNQKGAFGPPEFEEIKFSLNKDITFNIKVK